MKSRIAAVGLAAVNGGPDEFLGGEGGDLRVLVNDRCPQAYPAAEKALPDRSFGMASVAQQILAGLGGVAFESFGTFLKKAGQPDVTRSVGSSGGYFYAGSASSGSSAIAPSMRCIYLVRNGFASRQDNYASNSPADLHEAWRSLGLLRTPDFFAVLHVETAGEAAVTREPVRNRPDFEGLVEGAPDRPSASPPFFRLVFDRLYVRQFQNPSAAGGTRDLALIFNYGLASSPAAVAATGPAAGTTELTGRFAIGGLRFAGVREGDYGPAQLVSLQTGWMATPPSKPIDPRATVDISAYVVEFAPGNKFLEEIGSYLASDSVTSSVTEALKPTP
jgi:hypothetical protein